MQKNRKGYSRQSSLRECPFLLSNNYQSFRLLSGIHSFKYTIIEASGKPRSIQESGLFTCRDWRKDTHYFYIANLFVSKVGESLLQGFQFLLNKGRRVSRQPFLDEGFRFLVLSTAHCQSGCAPNENVPGFGISVFFFNRGNCLRSRPELYLRRQIVF